MASLSSFLPSSGSTSKPSGLKMFTVNKDPQVWKPISKPVSVTPTTTTPKVATKSATPTKTIIISPTQKKLNPNQLQNLITPYVEQAKQIGNKIQKAMPLTTQTINDIATNKPFNQKQVQAENRKIAKQVYDDLRLSFADYMKKGISADQKGISVGEKIVRKAETIVAGVNIPMKAISGVFQVLGNTPIIGEVVKAFSIPFAALEDSKASSKISNGIVDNLPVATSVKNRIRPVVNDALNLALQVALGHFLNIGTKKFMKVSEKVGVDTFEKFTKNVIEQSGNSKVVNFTPQDIKDINLGKPVYEADLIKQLGLKSTEGKTAVQKGISIEIPAEKITRIIDKPYWEKVKSVFNISPTDNTIVGQGTPTPRGDFAGLLPSGEVSPSEVIGKIMQAGKENTAQGKEFIKSAVEAQKNGQKMTIEAPKNANKTLPTQDQTLPQISKASDYVSAQDFAQEVYGTTPDKQIGLVDPNTIEIRDPVGTGTPEYEKLKTDIQKNGIKEPIRLDATGKPITVDGSQRTAIGKELGIKVPVIVNKGEIAGLKTIEQIYNDQTGADESLLNSDQAKEVESKPTPQTEKIKQAMEKIQEDIQMRRQDNEVKKSILDQFTPKQIQSMRIIKKSINARENKGQDATTVEQIPTYKENIHDVMSAIGTNSTDEALRFIREDLPDPLVNASSRAELEQIKVLKSHLTPKEVEVPRSQIPVGTGKEKVSRLEARMKTELDKLTQDKIDELGLTTYKELNLKENRQKAAQYVADNPNDALKVLQGEIEAPQGILKNNILWAMMQEAKGDMNLAIKLASIEATRFGQELVALRGIDPNNPVKLLNEVVRFREKQFEKRYGKKPIAQIKEKVVREIRAKVKKPDRYDWNSFINSIEC